MTSFLLAIFCFLFPTSTHCLAPMPFTPPNQPAGVVVQPTIALTYKTIFTSKPLTAGPHTFAISIRSSQPTVGYQLVLGLAGNVSNVAVTQSQLTNLQNITSQVDGTKITLLSIIADPTIAFKPTTITQVAQISFVADQPNMIISISQGSPFTKVTLYDKKTQDVKNLLENGVASVTIKQLN